LNGKCRESPNASPDMPGGKEAWSVLIGERIRPTAEWRSVLGKSEKGEVTVDGAKIRFWSQTHSDAPLLVFVHGGRANSAWWSLVLPSLKCNWLAMDLSGHGDSDWRTSYTIESWAREVVSVVGSVTPTGARAVVVGHSLGGIVAMHEIVRGHRGVGAVVSVDGAPMPSLGLRKMASPTAGFESFDDLLAHFRRARNREQWHQHFLEHVVRHSFRTIHGRLFWKHDPSAVAYSHPELSTSGAMAPGLLISGGQSLYAKLMSEGTFLRDSAGWLERLVVEGAGHDVMMEQPEAFLRSLRKGLQTLESRSPVPLIRHRNEKGR
jgi:pimeloyl-ACP methyl ester carboxylesterase